MDSNRKSRKARPLHRAPTIIGTGLIALDVVIADSIHVPPLLCAGGTCGNVLTALAYLDWNAYPVARLRADSASKRVLEDLKSWGVRLDFITLGDHGSTPVVIQHIRRNKAGELSHSFSRKCPKCGTWLPWYKAVKAADVSGITDRFPAADVFYFDRTSRGAIEFARYAKERGWLVVFEPSSGSEPALLGEALRSAHIVKIASDRLEGNDGVLDAKGPLLLIETRGVRGLRYKFRGSKGNYRWKKIGAFSHSAVLDTAGAGDWCTAGIIDRLGPYGVQGLMNASSDDVVAAITVGQAMAAWACQYYGARGGMYKSSKADFLKAVRSMHKGEKAVPNDLLQITSKLTSDEPLWCDSCLIEVGGMSRTVKRGKRR